MLELEFGLLRRGSKSPEDQAPTKGLSHLSISTERKYIIAFSTVLGNASATVNQCRRTSEGRSQEPTAARVTVRSRVWPEHSMVRNRLARRALPNSVTPESARSWRETVPPCPSTTLADQPSDTAISCLVLTTGGLVRIPDEPPYSVPRQASSR